MFLNHEAKAWRSNVISTISGNNIPFAITAVKNIRPNGGTDILRSFQLAFRLMKPHLTLLQDPGIFAKLWYFVFQNQYENRSHFFGLDVCAV